MVLPPPSSAPRCAAPSTPAAPPDTTVIPALARPTATACARVSAASVDSRAPTIATLRPAACPGGAEIVPLDVGNETHPWLQFAGMFKDDPMLDEWKQAMADYRDQVEKDDEYR